MTATMFCLAVQLTAGYQGAPPTPIAQLDQQGRWSITAQRDLERALLTPVADDPQWRCIIERLAAARLPDVGTLPKAQCTTTSQSIYAVIAADPIMRACQPPAKCEWWQTCS